MKGDIALHIEKKKYGDRRIDVRPSREKKKGSVCLFSHQTREKTKSKGGRISHFLHRKITIQEDSTIRSLIRFWKRDHCTRIYIFTDHFGVRILDSYS
jgi:hypothetical protein